MSERLHPGLNLHGTDPETHSKAEKVIFGFWIFLMADLILFALLFATYASMSVHGMANGPAPAQLFDLTMPLIQTVTLLGSSFAIGMAILHVKYDAPPQRLPLWLGATAVLGLLFLGLEAQDFYRLIFHAAAPPQRSGFLSAYFLLTGTHWLHVAAGLLWMAVLAVQIKVCTVTGDIKLRVMRLALYWHMLDVVWVGIFSFVYLFGVAQ